ncbi:MAG: DUF3010 family protein [Arcobacter sp.]|jgi:TusA-related sulfurtransferase|uniref:DUF3010 domain-containing protein n=1 Tax=Arcobacter defluvii TaxID=873191 RepID=A0AAE7BHQ2_9BACT|nr:MULTISPECIES: DUF3010 family protein [Arcobacter]MDY3200984.1 DUF3010 family protein [Arcobacter sp.]QKF77949.1 DUF3010 domain-containing protein [Arcobacter defluvii]RXI32727.1 DUF3010 domain-containing protein [Arcobacter defluvii]BAK73715.1 conserved hypothetical protein [Arcobacter sp. L]
MNICGIELKSNNLILVILNDKKYQDNKIKKIIFEDDEKQENIRKFCNEFLDFLQKNQIEKIYIKKRAKKGSFSGGAVTFKMEGLIQLNPICSVDLISTQTISSFEKKNQIVFPKELKKYQEQAFLTALCISN